MDHSITTAATLAGEKLINNALRFDPASRQQLSQLTDILAISLTSPAITFYCRGYCNSNTDSDNNNNINSDNNEQGIRITHYCDEPVSTQLSGSPFALLSLLKQPKSLANSGVELTGKVGLLQQWQNLLQNLDIDWEDAISTILGDIAGPMVTDSIGKGLSWAKSQQQEQQRLFKEYLTEELALLPTKVEVKELSEHNHKQTLRLDRLSARIDALTHSVTISPEQDSKA